MNLMLPPDPIHLPGDSAADAELRSGRDPLEVAADHPTSSAAWAAAARQARSGSQTVVSYAFARVGYHRGLDALRRAGWKGHGPVPWEHEPNRGFLTCLAELALAADAIGETDEAVRCRQFLADCSPTAAEHLRA